MFAIGDRVVLVNSRYRALDRAGVLVERPSWAERDGCLWQDGTAAPVVVWPGELRRERFP